MRTYEPLAGTHIKAAAQKMVEIVRFGGEPVTAKFNDIDLVATLDSTAELIVAEYDRISEERRVAYKASPEGQAAKARQEEFQRKADAARGEGIKPFEIIDQGAWDSWMESNEDDYGACVMRYAARWANVMESKMAAGEELEAIADAASSEADVEGITGFMYGCAVGVLSKCWKHGEKLRRWHNLKTQVSNEGVRANEGGGVLNPAILSIG